MKVRLLVSRSGADGAFSAGDIVEVSTDESARMVEAGQAEILRAVAPEKAVKRRKAERGVR